MIKSENMIPKVYMQSWDIRTFCRIFDQEFDLVRYYTDHILDCYSPENCPEDLLPELAAHIGFDYQELKSVMYNRVVLKNFIRNLIRYRGSTTGIRNAAAIDLRYREVYPDKRYDIATSSWVDDVDAGKLIPMTYYEAIPKDKVWIDVDSENQIIYLFLLSSSLYQNINPELSDDEQIKARMNCLLDLFYLQEYVRPVGMYLLPMVAEKVDAQTDMTVHAVRINEVERNWNNGVVGTPNASENRVYDRIHFAHTEDDTLRAEPWVRTLYHSQLAGNVRHQYFSAPVYYIQGKFLYYNHDELQKIYQKYQGVSTAKIGDSLYNPNLPGFNYGSNPADEPESLQQQNLAVEVHKNFIYDDHGVFTDISDVVVESGTGRLENDEWVTLVGVDIPVPESGGASADYPAYLSGFNYDTSDPESATPSTDKNLMVNLFNRQTDLEYVQGPEDINISGQLRSLQDKENLCYNPADNLEISGDDIYYLFRNDQGDTDIP